MPCQARSSRYDFSHSAKCSSSRFPGRNHEARTDLPIPVCDLPVSNKPPLLLFVLIITLVMLRHLAYFSHLWQTAQAFGKQERVVRAQHYLVKFFSLVISAFYAGLVGALDTIFRLCSIAQCFAHRNYCMMTILGGKGPPGAVGWSVFLFLQNTISNLTS
jgi:ABC-type branched-subunit amino acid transport system permease subunit